MEELKANWTPAVVHKPTYGGDGSKGQFDIEANTLRSSAQLPNSAFISEARKTFEGAPTIDVPKSKKSRGFTEFMNRSPRLRLALGGAVMAAGMAIAGGGAAISTAAGIGVGVLLSALTSPILTPFVGVTLGAIVGGVVVTAGSVLSLAAGYPVAKKGADIAGRAVEDIQKWNKFKKLLNEAGASKEEIKAAHQSFYSTSSEPIKTLIRHDNSLDNSVKKDLVDMADTGADRSVLWQEYRDAIDVGVPANLPDRSLEMVSGKVPWDKW